MATKERRVRVWVVEMWNLQTPHRPQWEPTVGVGLNRLHGREELRRWRARNPNDHCRLVPYVRQRGHR